MQYCIYLRKSRADMEQEARGEMETLARHEKALLELSTRLRLNITQIYREIVSGETLSSRPVAQRLLEEVERGEWEGVLVMEIERLARGDTIDQGIVARAFQLGGVKIITPLKTFDPTNEFDEEYFEFGLFMSRREYKTINRRIQRGRVASAREGKFLASTPPYGYRRVRIEGDKGYTLQVHTEEAQAVRAVFDMYIGGEGMTAIAARLDEMGIPPRRNECWSKSSIGDLLKNPVYTGKIRWAYRQEKKMPGKEQHGRVVNDDCILADGLHEPIISQEQFDTAQRLREQRRNPGVKKPLTLQNPLSGIVRCKKCGHLMTRVGAGGHNRYDTLRCANRQCDNISAPVAAIEQAILDRLEKWLAGYTIEIRFALLPEDSPEFLEATLRRLEKELTDTEKQRQTACELLERGVYTITVFSQRSTALTERTARLQGAADKARRLLESRTARKELPPIRAGILECYQTLDIQDKNRILRVLLDRAEYIKTEPCKKDAASCAGFHLDIYPRLPEIPAAE